MKFEMIDPGMKVQYVPDEKALAACFEMGKKIGLAM